LDLWEAGATWSMGHDFGLGAVVARIAHNLVLEDINTQDNLPLVMYQNSIAVIFTHITDQSTQHTLWVPFVPILFWNVHITFCAKNTSDQQLHTIQFTVPRSSYLPLV